MASFVRSLAFATVMTAASSQAWAAPHGLVVVATDGSTDAAWPLASAIYSDPVLRPELGERAARVLAGEKVEGDDMKNLAELRAGIKGEDAASKQLLGAISDETNAQGILLVQTDANGRSTAREWIASAKNFDAATYVALKEDGKITWPDVVASLRKQWTPPPPAIVQNAKPISNEKVSSSKPFYLSPWFWGAIGAALVGGLAVVLATQDYSSDSLRLKLRVP